VATTGKTSTACLADQNARVERVAEFI